MTTKQELEHIFRFQLTADEDYTPTGNLEYWLFEGNDRMPGKVEAGQIETLINLLEGYQFDGYRDRTPLFVKIEEV